MVQPLQMRSVFVKKNIGSLMMRVLVVFTALFSLLTSVAVFAGPSELIPPKKCSLEAIQEQYDFRLAITYLFSDLAEVNLFGHVIPYQDFFGIRDSLSRPLDAYVQDVQACHGEIIREASQAGVEQCSKTPDEINAELDKAASDARVQHQSAIIIIEKLPSSDVTFAKMIEQATGLNCENISIFGADLEVSGVESLGSLKPVNVEALVNKYFPNLGSNENGKARIQDIIATAHQNLQKKIFAHLAIDPKRYSPDQIQKLLAPYEDAFEKIANSTYL
jgi:hypothetical protein